MKKKYFVTLFAGLLLLILGIVFCLKTYNSSYATSLTTKTAISAVEKEIKNVEAQLEATEDATEIETLTVDLESLKLSKDALNQAKLAYEKPYSYSLTVLFIGIILTILAIVKMISKSPAPVKADLNKLAQAGLLAALCYIGFAFFKIDIPVGTEKTAFHLGNVFCVLAALLLGGFWGGMAGAVGMTIADLTTAYVTSAPKTFILKFCIGLIVGLVAHKIFHLDECKDKKKVTFITILASFAGMAFNVVADPLVGYFYKTYLLGIPQDITKALLKISQATTLVNAILAVVFASIFYLALRPALKKAGLLATEK